MLGRSLLDSVCRYSIWELNFNSLTFPGNYYELLGVPRSADLPTLRKSFRDLSKALHPDTTSLPEEEAARKFQEVCEAYQILSDPILRDAYDASSLEGNIPEVRVVVSETQYGNNLGKLRGEEVRRPFSGGELFSLFLLGVALVISLLVGVVFALLQGKDLQVLPSWLVSGSTLSNYTLHEILDVLSSIG